MTAAQTSAASAICGIAFGWTKDTASIRPTPVRDSASISEDEVKDYVKSNLARYKVPRDVEFLDELPRNATGKVLKRELADDGDSSDGNGKARSSRSRSKAGS